MTKKMVFDIECIGVDFDSLDEKSQHDLTKWAKTDEEREAEKEKLALYAVTGRIVAISMLNPDTDGGKTLYTVEGDNDKDKGQWTEDDKLYVPCVSEKELLEKWWQDVAQYDQIISFNGRGFDAPYILFRSMIYDLVPSKNLMPNRFGDYRTGFNAHLDLADQLAYYGASRKFSLHMYTTALGITSPKEEGEDGEIIDGMAVPRLYSDGEYKVIARYCMRDVVATSDLYKRWMIISK